MRALLTELVGTFFLVLTIGLTVLEGTPFAPLAIGVSLMVMVYMGGHVSGAHYNPAVTLALAIRRKFPWRSFGPYVVSQLVGATLAALTVYLIRDNTFAPTPSDEYAAGLALVVETLYTFALALVVLNVAATAKTAGNSFYGLAIGFTVVAAAFAGGPVSGGAFNPAVGTGPTIVNALMGGGNLDVLWIYWVGPLLGGALAALVHAVQEESTPI